MERGSTLKSHGEINVLTDVHDPPETNLMNETAISEALDPESESKSTPRADEIPRSFPKENGHTTSHEARYSA